MGEPTPMKREQEIGDIAEKLTRAYPSDVWEGWLARETTWLLSELARLRTEAHQMQEARLSAEDLEWVAGALRWQADIGPDEEHNVRLRRIADALSR